MIFFVKPLGGVSFSNTKHVLFQLTIFNKLIKTNYFVKHAFIIEKKGK